MSAEKKTLLSSLRVYFVCTERNDINIEFERSLFKKTISLKLKCLCMHIFIYKCRENKILRILYKDYCRCFFPFHSREPQIHDVKDSTLAPSALIHCIDDGHGVFIIHTTTHSLHGLTRHININHIQNAVHTFFVFK